MLNALTIEVDGNIYTQYFVQNAANSEIKQNHKTEQEIVYIFFFLKTNDPRRKKV